MVASPCLPWAGGVRVSMHERWFVGLLDAMDRQGDAN